MLTDTQRNKLCGRNTAPVYISSYIYISFVSVFVEVRMGVYKPLSPARKLCLLCSLGPLLRCQIGSRTWSRKTDSKVLHASRCVFTEPKHLEYYKVLLHEYDIFFGSNVYKYPVIYHSVKRLVLGWTTRFESREKQYFFFSPLWPDRLFRARSC
jgi:hypothetical protein